MMNTHRNRGPRTSRMLIAILVGMVFVLASCGGGDDASTAATDAASSAGDDPTEQPAPSEQPAELTPVRVAFNPGTVLQLYAALGNDLFEKHGLDVELIQFESGAATNAAFASGDVDLGFSGAPGIIASRLGGAGTRIVLVDNEGGGAEGLVVTPESGITSVRDLPGKTIGTVIGTTPWMALMAALEAEGIDPSEVDIQNVAPNAWVPAFENNDVDGIWGWAPLIFMLEQDSGGTLVARDTDYTITPLFWQARGDFIDENPEAVEAFVAAYDEAYELVETSDPEFIAEMLERTGVTEPVAEATIEGVQLVPVEDMVSDDSPYSLTSPDGVRQYFEDSLDMLIENGIFTERPDLEGITDPTAIESYLAR